MRGNARVRGNGKEREKLGKTGGNGLLRGKWLNQECGFHWRFDQFCALILCEIDNNSKSKKDFVDKK